MQYLQTEGTSRRCRGLSLVAGILLAGFVQAHTAAAASAVPASDFVRKVAVSAMDILADRSATAADRKRRFAAVVDANFDVDGIGRYVVGDAWQAADKKTRADFLKVFHTALARTYTKRFFDYDGHSLKIHSTKDFASGSIMVKCAVEDPVRGETYDVGWMVTGPDSDLKLFDVTVDGVSTTITTRDEYAAALSRSGGDLSKLTDMLVAKLR